jgi:MFS transporter, PPP family, 3-phenylpropionic acid transporter
MPFARPLPLRLAAFYFAFFAWSAAYVAYLPLYLAWRGLDAGEIALVLALPQLARIFAPGAWGWLADRFAAQRGIVVLACAAMLAGFAALPFAPGVASIALLIALTGVFSAGALPLVEAITLGAPGGLARYGPIRLWGSVGFVAVVLAGGIALDFVPVVALPRALVVLALASLVAAVALPKGASHPAAPPLRIAIPPAARAALGAGFCMAAAHGVLYAFLTLHLQREGYSGAAIGTLWTLGVLAEIVVFAFLPALFRRYRLSSILAASFLCAVARFLAIGWAAGLLPLLVLAQLAHAATFGSFHAASVAAVHRAFPAQAQGRGQALFSSLSYGAGGAAGAILAGWAWEAGGPQLAFSLAAFTALVGLYFAYTLKRTGF